MTVWYRYIDYDVADKYPYLIELPVKRHTAKSTVLNEYGRERFVLNEARKRYAYPTKELALESYIQRKKRQIQYASNAHDTAVNCLEWAERLRDGLPEEIEYIRPII